MYYSSFVIWRRENVGNLNPQNDDALTVLESGICFLHTATREEFIAGYAESLNTPNHVDVTKTFPK